MKKLVLPFLVAITVFSVAFAGVYFLVPKIMAQPLNSQTDPRSVEPRPVILNQERLMPDFTLTDQEGRAVKLSSLRGKVVVMFFGYTSCPDICPLTLIEMKKAKAALGGDADKVAFVFISVDGERDTPAVLKRYLASFDSDFIGLTGSPDQVRVVAAEYSASFTKNKPKNSQTAYVMIHSSNTYLLDAQGRWRIRFAYATKPETIAQVASSILAE